MSKPISFVRGFRPPTQEKIDQALGDDASFSDQFKNSFNGLPSPTSDLDWLATYRERGQTYATFLKECPCLDEDDFAEKYIYLTLLDNDDQSSSLDIDRLVEYTHRFFQMKVKLLPLFSNIRFEAKKRKWICTTKGRNDSTRETTLRTRYNPETGHSQIYAQNVLDLLKRSVPADAHCLVAITLHDFYSDETDLFIAGLARGECRVAAFSFFRYDPRLEHSEELWYDWRLKKTKSKAMSQIILLRSCRLLTHEIGHLLGIDHCIYYACLMNGSGHLEEDFSQPLFLCPVDLRKLSRLVGFNVVQRYEQLLAFCTENQFEEESELLGNRLEILKNTEQSTPKKGKKKTIENDGNQRAKRLKKN